jgi:hypothetical protein
MVMPYAVLQEQGVAYWGGGVRRRWSGWPSMIAMSLPVTADDAVTSSRAGGGLAYARRATAVPLMDLEDQSRVRYADLWGGIFQQVEGASGVVTPAVLIGRISAWTRAVGPRWQITMVATPAAGRIQIAADCTGGRASMMWPICGLRCGRPAVRRRLPTWCRYTWTVFFTGRYAHRQLPGRTVHSA